MESIDTIKEMRAAIKAAKASEQTVGLVPTMGAYHQGHLGLMKAASKECDLTVVSLFVNPTQFGTAEDLDSYPRDLEKDALLAEEAGADVLFAPAVKEVYPEEQTVWVDPGPLARHLCGQFRPGHFKGVATVVAKLFNIIQPDRAYFGEKDYQQTLVVKEMTEQLNLPVNIRSLPTVREKDGLAMSSRNAYLNNTERQAAAILYRSLSAAGEFLQKEKGLTGQEVAAYLARATEEEPLFRLQYAEARDPQTLEPLGALGFGEPVLLALAGFIGNTRLIDNLVATTGK